MDKQTSQFDPQYVDEQIAQMRRQAESSTPGGSLIEDLYALHDEDLQIGDRVWARLSRMADMVPGQQTRSITSRGENLLNIAEYQEPFTNRKGRKIMEKNTSSWGMHPPMPIAESKKRRPPVWRVVSIGLIAAVALITIVSFTVFSGVLRPAPQTTNNTSAITGSQNHPQQQSQQQQSQQQKVIIGGKQACSLNAGEKVSTNGAPWSADVNWSAQGQLAVTTYNGVKVYSTKDCKATAFSQPQIQQAYHPAWSFDGSKLLVSDAGDKSDYVLDSNGKIITTAKDHILGGGVWSSDGKKIIFSWSEGDQMALTDSAEMPKTFKVSIKAVDFTNGNKVTTISQLPDNYNVQSLLPGGKLALLAHVDKATWNKDKAKIAVWDINAGKLMTSDVVLPDLTQGYDYQLSPDGSLIALDQEGKIDIYTTADGKLLTSFENKVTGKGEHTLAWSPDGKYLAESANTIKIFDITAKKLATTFGQVDAQHWITALVWSPDGTGIATSSMVLSNDQPSDLTVNVWALS
jgi:Tol biopolymer transport system component